MFREKIIHEVDGFYEWDLNPIVSLANGKKTRLFELFQLWRKKPILAEVVFVLSNRVLTDEGIYQLLNGYMGIESSGEELTTIRHSLKYLIEKGVVQNPTVNQPNKFVLYPRSSSALATSVIVFNRIYVLGRKFLLERGITPPDNFTEMLNNILVGSRGDFSWMTGSDVRLESTSIKWEILKLFEQCPEMPTFEVASAFGADNLDSYNFEVLRQMLYDLKRKGYIGFKRLTYVERMQRARGSVWVLTPRGKQALDCISELFSDPLSAIDHPYGTAPWWLVDEETNHFSFNRMMAKATENMRGQIIEKRRAALKEA